MRKLLSFSFLLLYTTFLFAQNPIRCYTDEKLQQHIQQFPGLEREMEKEELGYRLYALSQQHQKSGGGTIATIPVVVHIIQSSSTVNIPDSRVYSQIEILNEDFRKMAGTNGDGAGVDVSVEFCLATIDENGCPTTGINRIVSPSLAVHDQNQEAQLKALSHWSSYKYLNVWVPESISGGILGYATFPFLLSSSPNLDGVVIGGAYFGRNSPGAPYNQGRTATHEVGHWLGLFHTFQGGCAGTSPTTCTSQGDMICDTPPTSSANYGCPNTQNTCTETPTDLDDQTENYMDYVDDLCMNMYTQGQSDRIWNFLNGIRSQIWDSTNLAATGCDGTVSTLCSPQVDFEADYTYICVGETVQFTDLSQGPPDTWAWDFGDGGQSTDQHPSHTYTTAGVYNVSMTGSNSLGTQSETKTSYITVQESQSPPLVEGFESILFLPAGWRTEDNSAAEWALSTQGASSGSKSMKCDNFGVTPGGNEDIVTFPVNMTNVLSGTLDFDYAYKIYNSFKIDSLQVLVSDDCGRNWDVLWEKGGSSLATVSGLAVSSGYVPGSSDWLTVNVDMNAYAGMDNVVIAFRVISGGGQNVWLDNINMSLVVSTQEALSGQWGLSTAPNPFRDRLELSCSLPAPSGVAVTLTDLHGRTLWSTMVEGKPGDNPLLISPAVLSTMPAGMYLVRAESRFGRIVRKVIKSE